MREKVIQTIEQEKIIVIVRGVERSKLIPLAEAMYSGGIRLLEITFDADGRVSDDETAEGVGALVEHFKNRMYIGAGTVLNVEQVRRVKEAGGSFIISPQIDRAVIEETRRLQLVSMPGALTPSEICAADAYGADFVKVFPAGCLGAGYIKAIRAPLSHIRLTAVGGIDDQNMADYIRAGVSGFGVGTNIVNKKMLHDNDYEGLTQLAGRYVAAAKGSSR